MRSAIPLGLTALLTASCGALPDDHAFVGVVGRSLQRAADGVRAVSRAVDSGGRDLNALAGKVAAVPDSVSRELGRLEHASMAWAADTTDRLTALPSRTTALVDRFVAESARRVGRLRVAPARIGLDVERNLGEFRRGIWDTPRILNLERTPMAGAGDPERTVEIVPRTRRRSWLERVLDRMAF